jgi:hypothetical protein
MHRTKRCDISHVSGNYARSEIICKHDISQSNFQYSTLLAVSCWEKWYRRSPFVSASGFGLFQTLNFVSLNYYALDPSQRLCDAFPNILVPNIGL